MAPSLLNAVLLCNASEEPLVGGADYRVVQQNGWFVKVTPTKDWAHCPVKSYYWWHLERFTWLAPAWLQEAFDELNAKHFAGTLRKPEIAIWKTPGKTTAATAPLGDFIFISPQIFEQHRQWATDTLLHEMIHVALIEENGDGDAAHADRFTAHANRIGAAIGVREVAPRSKEALSWPQSIRPLSYPAWVGSDCPIPRLEPTEAEEIVVYEVDVEAGAGAPAHADAEELVVELVINEDDLSRF